ncbi:hypothetical protein PR001_g14415 [Phytophthora rubi]|uniref:Uncharacterized protein n=1 Tax=Phytophthora rubi TaxID=129364 RepID=A0A6A3KUN2_9STRA|nr:hypothetical protein PR002_g15150 [Phytophthora rubi]KAE9017385.1 hypothetical protein PR001_g14415 [Phytophthora rubi]
MFSHHPGRAPSRFEAAWLEWEKEGVVRSLGRGSKEEEADILKLKKDKEDTEAHQQSLLRALVSR